MRYFKVHVGTRYTGEDWIEYWKCEGHIEDVWRGKLVNEIMEDNARYWWDVSGAYEEEPFEDWLKDCYCEVTEMDESEIGDILESDWNTVIWDESYDLDDEDGWIILRDGLELEDLEED